LEKELCSMRLDLNEQSQKLINAEKNFCKKQQLSLQTLIASRPDQKTIRILESVLSECKSSIKLKIQTLEKNKADYVASGCNELLAE